MEPDLLLSFFKRGLIPGPSESEDAFIRRIQSHQPLPFPEWKEIATPMLAKWGFSIDWIPITYSSKGLLPWEGAVFWIKENGQPLLQLRPSLQTKKLWGNSSSEILMHEAIHAAREAFHEPQFEEFLAYTTSRTPWKRWFGPFFQRFWEFPLLTLALFSLPLFPKISLPILLLFLGRFFYRLHLFRRLKREVPLPILLCLTDREIQKGIIAQAPLLADNSMSPRYQLIEALKRQLS